MAKRRKKKQKWDGGYQKRFEEFRKEAAQNTDLAPEVFAIECGIRYSVPIDRICRFIEKDNKVLALWHGTTEDRARRIAGRGFRRGAWFTQRFGYALSIAKGRARERESVPTVIACEIDLDAYTAFKHRSLHVYNFYSYVGPEVIRNVFTIRDDALFGHLEDRQVSGETAPGIVTAASGKSEVLSWISMYLEAAGGRALTDKHPAFEVAWRWIEAQYTQGRKDAISAKEMSFLMVIIGRMLDAEEVEIDNQPPEETPESEGIDVTITQTSGKLGVLWWLNCYLAMKGRSTIDEAHPAVEAIFRWVESEYAAGRAEEISNAEMLTQATTHLKGDSVGI